MSIRRLIWCLASVATVLAVCLTAFAQEFPSMPVSSYVGQNVSSVEVAGRPDVSYNTVQGMIALKPNQPLTEQAVNATVNALKTSPGVTDVRVNLQPSADGVQVEFVLRPAMYIGMYQFPGGLNEFTYTRLLQVANYNAQMPYSATDVSSAEESLTQFFQQQGYFEAEVTPKLQEDREHGLINVLFQTTLGRRAKFGKVDLQGANPKETAYLQQKLRSVLARMKGVSLREGKPYYYGRLQRATSYLQSQLAKQDYLAANVKLVGAEYNPANNRADITFHIEVGPTVKIKTTGAHMWKSTVRKLVPIYAAQAVDDELVREGQQNILSYWQKKGYFDAKVDVQQDKTPGGVSIVYDIHKDRRNKVKDVDIAGNQHISAQELKTHVSVKQASWLFFSHGNYSQQMVNASAKNLKATYVAAGYAQAQVVPTVTRNNGDINVTFQVTEGPLTTVHSLTIEGNNTMAESVFAPHGLNLGPGKPYSQALVTKDRNQIVAQYLTQGYLDAGFKASAKPVPGEPTQMDVVYQINEGPQVKTATIITDGRGHTRQSFLDKKVRLKPGQPLSENDMLAAESRLYDQNIFDWAEIDPKRTIIDQTSEDVVVKVHEAKRNSIVYGFGFQVLNRGGAIPSGTVAVPGIPPVGLPNNFVTSQKTFWGPDATFEYTRRNMRGRAETLNFSSFVGRLDQRGALTYTDPSFKGSKWQATELVSAEHNSENPIFTDRIGNAQFQLQRGLWGPKIHGRSTWNLFLRYNFQYTHITDLLIPELVPANQLNVHLSTVSASLVHDTRDDVLDAHRGVYFNYELDLSPYWLGSNFSFAQFVSQSAYYKGIGKGIVWASSLRVGLEQPFAGSEVPVSSKFFAGGGSTLRGFPLNGAGPQRTIPVCGNPSDPATCSKITVPDGGNELLIINTELRYPLNFIKQGLGIVTFYDGGNVFPTVGFHDFTSLYSNNVGIGFRYATPVGPVRIDIGHNLNPIPGIKSTQYFITLGQAF